MHVMLSLQWQCTAHIRSQKRDRVPWTFDICMSRLTIHKPSHKACVRGLFVGRYPSSEAVWYHTSQAFSCRPPPPPIPSHFLSPTKTTSLPWIKQSSLAQEIWPRRREKGGPRRLCTERRRGFYGVSAARPGGVRGLPGRQIWARSLRSQSKPGD